MTATEIDAAVRERISQAVDALPTNERDIAALLLARGITGSPINAATCPIATYLNTMIDRRTHYTMATRDWIYLYPVDADQSGGSVTQTPPGVADFIRLFDRRAYPLLIKPPVEDLDEDA